jgi:hypothetical protein
MVFRSDSEMSGAIQPSEDRKSCAKSYFFGGLDKPTFLLASDLQRTTWGEVLALGPGTCRGQRGKNKVEHGRLDNQASGALSRVAFPSVLRTSSSC